ncbi:MAG: SMP-30/gluconolactonase/LRE family protein [Candidatus Bathyarchaeota archaeon]|nr:SMP-30/gluconolactonase/LRE family protein [Candidatus Bathyarchaeota archaeon]
MILNSRKNSTLIQENSEVERLATRYQFLEGPVWSSAGGFLLFSDIPENRIYKWVPDGFVTVFREPSGNSNGLTFDKRGNLIICEHGTRRLSMLEKNGFYRVLADRYRDKRLNSPNDVVVKSDGKIYFTDPPYGIKQNEQELTFQGVYSLDVEQEKLTLLSDDFDRPNGLAFSPDEKVLYIADSSKRRHVRAFEVESDGNLSRGSVFAEIRSELPGNPDGMKVDLEGNLYVATAGGIWVFSAQGKHLGVINTPETPANLAWGARDWRSLFITAGTSLYRVKMKAKGVRV